MPNGNSFQLESKFNIQNSDMSRSYCSCSNNSMVLNGKSPKTQSEDIYLDYKAESTITNQSKSNERFATHEDVEVLRKDIKELKGTLEKFIEKALEGGVFK